MGAYLRVSAQCGYHEAAADIAPAIEKASRPLATIPFRKRIYIYGIPTCTISQHLKRFMLLALDPIEMLKLLSEHRSVQHATVVRAPPIEGRLIVKVSSSSLHHGRHDELTTEFLKLMLPRSV